MLTQCNQWSYCLLIVVVFVLVLSVNAFAQAVPNEGTTHLVSEYGTFIIDDASPATIATNNATLNKAIVEVGKAGGGTIKLPLGTFHIGPDTSKADRAITIGYDNITLIGYGVGRTILKTNGTWDPTTLRRGHGIVIEGTHTAGQPRKNIVLKDFELDGQAGWTGEYNWPAEPKTGAGWDINHKGIVGAWDAYCDNIVLENLFVHHYRGEILYVGGTLLGKLTLRNVKMANTNGSDFNLYAADLLVENCEFGGPSRFWAELLARPNGAGYPVNQMVFRNNKFWNVVDPKINAGQIAICQGDFKPYAMTFDHNDIRDCPDIFGFYGGVAGPITITNNTITNCKKVIFFGGSGGWLNSDMNANITVEHNTITHGVSLAEFSGIRGSNVFLRDNTFTGISPTNLSASTAVMANNANITNTVVENNIFTDCRTPIQQGRLIGQRTLFRNNSYRNTMSDEGQGSYTVTPLSLLVTPQHEAVKIMTDTDKAVVALATNQYPDGQIIAVTGGTPTKRVCFAAGQASYIVARNRYLNGAITLYFKYNSKQARWIEGQWAVQK